MPLIYLDSVSFKYPDSDSYAIRGVSLSIDQGEYVALVGGNGSGKSTLVRLFNGLRSAGEGLVRVDGLDPSLRSNMFAVRSSVTLVFQSPVDQIVSSCVEEDVAFGPSNLGLPREEIEARVASALEATGLSGLRTRPTRSLSGGQQQKLAIAGALAMNPRCVVFDEATSMLDPRTKRSVLELMERLVEKGVGVVHVTHDMDDAARAGRIVALEGGRLAFDGNPQAFFGDHGIRTAGLKTEEGEPPALSLGLGLPRRFATVRAFKAFRSATPDQRDNEKSLGAEVPVTSLGAPARQAGADPAFTFGDVSFSYLRGTVNEVRALDGVSFSIPRGARVACVGKTGSGKSTALQLLNALFKPVRGKVVSLGIDTSKPDLDAGTLRIRAPFSIQRPESALFEIYAADDVAFGPKNLGVGGLDLVRRVSSWMDAAGVPYSEFRDRITRGLSGGEKRKLALAGVFAMESEAVLLDEPTAALDPYSQKAVFNLLDALAAQGVTVVFATHSMEEAARSDYVAVFNEGILAAFGEPRDIFYERFSEDWGIALPYAVQLCNALRQAGIETRGQPLSIEDIPSAAGRDFDAALSLVESGAVV